MKCLITECSGLVKARGYCWKHYQRNRRHGNPGPPPPKVMSPSQDNLIGWNVNGYRRIRIAGKEIYQHRWVMERVLGRTLRDNENVHHINGDRMDNRPENLELWVISQPSGQRPIDLVSWAREIIDRYADEVDRGL